MGLGVGFSVAMGDAETGNGVVGVEDTGEIDGGIVGVGVTGDIDGLLVSVEVSRSTVRLVLLQTHQQRLLLFHRHSLPDHCYCLHQH